MVRPFAPNPAAAPSVEFFKSIKERALECAGGEWVRHIPQGNDNTGNPLNPPQWVFMKYQYIPSDASIRPEFIIDGTDPMLFGLLDHFEVEPKTYKHGHSGKQARGSIFEVQGIMYRAKKVASNQWGYLDITLIRDENCTEPRVEFCDEVAQLGCQVEVV